MKKKLSIFRSKYLGSKTLEVNSEKLILFF